MLQPAGRLRTGRLRSRRRQVASSVDSTCPRCTARGDGQTSTSAASDSLPPSIDTHQGAHESQSPIISASARARAWAVADWRGCPGFPQLGRGATGIAAKVHAFRQRLRFQSGTRNVAQGIQFATPVDGSARRVQLYTVMPSPSSLPFPPPRRSSFRSSLSGPTTCSFILQFASSGQVFRLWQLREPPTN
jgi:hypothetical protein